MIFEAKFTEANHTLNGEFGEVSYLPNNLAWTKGFQEGQQAEYDRFWDSFQQNGNRRNYPNGFSGSCWKDDTYNPKYEIIVTNSCGEMFKYNSPITSTKVPITIDSAISVANVFTGCTRLREIPSIKVTEKVPSFSGWFQSCDSLTTINFTDDSVIGNSINFQWSPLTPESAWNVVQHLKLAEAVDYLKYTVTFSAAVWEALDEYQRENDLTGGWQFVREYIENWIGWRTA
jgi:hypothetical protein